MDVWRYPGPENQRPSELATQTRMTKQALNYLLGQLEELGYLTRETDSNDQRSKRVRLTPRGHAATKAIYEIVQEVEDDWNNRRGHESSVSYAAYSRSSTRSPRRPTTRPKGRQSAQAATPLASTRPQDASRRNVALCSGSHRTHDPADARADMKAGPELELDPVAQIATGRGAPSSLALDLKGSSTSLGAGRRGAHSSS